MGIKHVNRIAFARDFMRKVLALIKTNRLRKMSPILYLVTGYHSSLRPSHPQNYFVEEKNGKWVCNCPGFETYGCCTHALAVFILEGYEKRSEQQKTRLETAAKEIVGHG